MNREILFRGKSYTDDKWHYGYYMFKFATPFTAERHEVVDGAGLGWNCPLETIGQYTGLKDVHGKRIFEGDIVRGCFDHEMISGHIIYGSDATFFIQRDGLHGIGLNNAPDWVEAVGKVCEAAQAGGGAGK